MISSTRATGRQLADLGGDLSSLGTMLINFCYKNNRKSTNAIPVTFKTNEIVMILGSVLEKCNEMHGFCNLSNWAAAGGSGRLARSGRQLRDLDGSKGRQKSGCVRDLL